MQINALSTSPVSYKILRIRILMTKDSLTKKYQWTYNLCIASLRGRSISLAKQRLNSLNNSYLQPGLNNEATSGNGFDYQATPKGLGPEIFNQTQNQYSSLSQTRDTRTGVRLREL